MPGAADTIDALIEEVRASAGKPDAPPPPRARPIRPRGAPPRGVNPWLVVGAAFAVGFLAAKLIDWRGHAHPRR
jgi:hypothetical protein